LHLAAEVTRAGGEELAEPYVIRPTSETIIGYSTAGTQLARPAIAQSVGECDAPPVPATAHG